MKLSKLYILILYYTSLQCLESEYDQSRIFDIRPKPKFSFLEAFAKGISQSRRYDVL